MYKQKDMSTHVLNIDMNLYNSVSITISKFIPLYLNGIIITDYLEVYQRFCGFKC